MVGFSFSFYESATWRGLTVYEKLVHHYLANRGYKKGFVNMSVQGIALDLKLNRKTIIAATDKLHKAGFIKKNSSNRRKTVYQLVPPNGTNTSNQSVPYDGTNQSVPPDGINTVGRTLSVPPDGTHSKVNKYRRRFFEENTPEHLLAVSLWEDITRHGTAAKKPDLQKCAAVFDLMHRVDKRPYHWLKKIILTAREKDTWLRDNMRGPDAARKWINAGRLDKYAPDDFMTDAEVLTTVETERAAA